MSQARKNWQDLLNKIPQDLNQVIDDELDTYIDVKDKESVRRVSSAPLSQNINQKYAKELIARSELLQKVCNNFILISKSKLEEALKNFKSELTKEPFQAPRDLKDEYKNENFKFNLSRFNDIYKDFVYDIDLINQNKAKFDSTVTVILQRIYLAYNILISLKQIPHNFEKNNLEKIAAEFDKLNAKLLETLKDELSSPKSIGGTIAKRLSVFHEKPKNRGEVFSDIVKNILDPEVEIDSQDLAYRDGYDFKPKK